jgi:PAS domain S-box-containing protein
MKNSSPRRKLTEELQKGVKLDPVGNSCRLNYLETDSSPIVEGNTGKSEMAKVPLRKIKKNDQEQPEQEVSMPSQSKIIRLIRNHSGNMFQPSFGDPSKLGVAKNPYYKFSKVAELSPALILIADRQGFIEYANPSFLELSQYREEEIIGWELDGFKSRLDYQQQYTELKMAVEKGEKWKGELINSKKRGGTFVFSATLTPVRNEYDFITNFIIVGQDITPFRETEKKLKLAVEEKTVLLSELHHRVKNNLAIISGLMQLQAFTEGDVSVRSKLYSSVGRVQAMANMHELLYESGSFSRLEFGQNLKKIVTSISKMYYELTQKIDVKLDVESVMLNINQAHPCSLIMNEVITNAYKHAFTKAESGKIRIQLYNQEQTVYISIADNGSGLPEDFDIDRDKTLGNTLLKTLVKQLNGSYQYISDEGGTTFTLCFQKENIKGSAGADLS